MLRNLLVIVGALKANLLNEVLSLNAQEFHSVNHAPVRTFILNEVLSLNAQEFVELEVRGDDPVLSSMKS